MRFSEHVNPKNYMRSYCILTATQPPVAAPEVFHKISLIDHADALLGVLHNGLRTHSLLPLKHSGWTKLVHCCGCFEMCENAEMLRWVGAYQRVLTRTNYECLGLGDFFCGLAWFHHIFLWFNAEFYDLALSVDRSWQQSRCPRHCTWWPLCSRAKEWRDAVFALRCYWANIHNIASKSAAGMLVSMKSKHCMTECKKTREYCNLVT